ncbi:MAG: DUF4367 domain-containing protein [Romboutsia sp.]
MKDVNLSDEDLRRCITKFDKIMLDNISIDPKNFEHIFSSEFGDKMDTLIKNEKKIIKNNHFSRGRKLIITLCITITCILTASLSIEAVRVKVISIIKEIYSDLTMFTFSNDQSLINSSSSFTEPKYMPEGFKEIDRFISDIGINITYENSDMLRIGYQIDKISRNTLILDTEDALVKNIFINGFDAQYIQKGPYVQLFWNDGTYIYLVYKDFPTDKITQQDESELIKIAESVKK